MVYQCDPLKPLRFGGSRLLFPFFSKDLYGPVLACMVWKKVWKAPIKKMPRISPGLQHIRRRS